MVKQSVARVLRFVVPLYFVLANGAVAYEAKCQNVADCGRQGEAAYKRQDYQAAISFYQMQMQDAEEDKMSCELASPKGSEKACDSITITAYNNLALANLHANEPVKAQMWLSIAPVSSSTRFNKRLVASAIATHRWPASPEGQYWSSVGFGLWNEVTVTKSGDLYDISFEGFWMPSRGWLSGANSGNLSDVVAIRERIAVLHSHDEPKCAVTAQFESDHVELSDTDECRRFFGANVQASGTFIRVSSPKR